MMVITSSFFTLGKMNSQLATIVDKKNQGDAYFCDKTAVCSLRKYS